MITRKLLDILVCPVTKSKLYYNKESEELISLPARLAYKIKDDIPIMLESEAREINPDEYENLDMDRANENNLFALDHLVLTTNKSDD